MNLHQVKTYCSVCNELLGIEVPNLKMWYDVNYKGAWVTQKRYCQKNNCQQQAVVDKLKDKK